MTRTATAFAHADHPLTALEQDARTLHPLARGAVRVALGAAIVGIMFVFVGPLTLPWIATAYVGAATILVTTYAANR